MSSPHPVYPTRFGRGLDLVTAPELMEEGSARVLRNWRHTGQGRITTRKAAIQRNQGFLDVLAIVPFTHVAGVAAVVLDYDDPNNQVDVHTVDAEGAIVSSPGSLAGWAPAARPTVHAAVLNQALFVVDEDRLEGLTVYDPVGNLGGGTLFQPTFDFDLSGTGHAPLTARFIIAHLNHLWVLGYGDETDPDRPEYARFSYLGLVADGHGAGDAGSGGVAGSTGLFDAEDALPLADRGELLLFGSSAPGRLLLCTNRQAGVVFGTDYASWRYDRIDAERGIVNSLAGAEADGVAYWWSQLGPSRYRGGGRVESDFGLRVAPRTAEMDLTTMFCVHAIEEHQVRWYYRRRGDTAVGVDRWIGYDYEEDAWVEDVLGGIRPRCAGYLRPSGLEGPAGAPSGVAHSEITNRSALATWTPGDFYPGTITKVWLATDNGGVPGTYVLVDEVRGGTREYRHTALAAGTTYWTKVQQIRNGQATASAEASFTTLTSGLVGKASNVVATDAPVWQGSENTGEWVPRVLITFDLTQVDVIAILYRHRPAVAGGLQIIQTARQEDVTTFEDYDVEVGLEYEYAIVLRDRFGNVSDTALSNRVTPTIDRYRQDPAPEA